MKPITTLATLLLAALTTASPLHAQIVVPPPAPPAGNVFESSYERDLRSIMDNAQLLVHMKTPLPGTPAKSKPEREFEAAFMQLLTRETMYLHLQPAFAKVFDAQQTAAIARLSANPVFIKRERLAVGMPGRVSYGSSLFTDSEAAELRRIDASPAMAIWRAGQARLKAEVFQAMKTWAGQFANDTAVRAMKAIYQVQLDLAATRETDKDRKIVIGRVGLSYLDQMIWASGSSQIKIFNAHRRFNQDMERFGLFDALLPARVVSRSGLALSRTALERTEQSLETMQKEVRMALKEREEGMRAIEFPGHGEFQKHLEKGLASAYGFYVDFDEANRRAIDQYRHALSFFEERQEHVQFKDGRLIFDNDADLAMMRDIMGNVQAAAKDLQRIVSEQEAREEDYMKRATNGKVQAPPAAAPAAG
ncbi:hypothetical protein HSX11_28260 [Oxalobacteraceae bacterium]|nr:hypothetical protein [Oxalobacteraceae bacterium]